MALKSVLSCLTLTFACSSVSEPDAVPFGEEVVVQDLTGCTLGRFAADDDGLYWACLEDRGSLMALDTGATTARLVTGGRGLDGVFEMLTIAGADLAYIDSDLESIVSVVGKSGGDARTIAIDEDAAFEGGGFGALSAAADGISWWDRRTSQVMRANLDGDLVMTVGEAQASPTFTATSRTHTYWVADGAIWRSDGGDAERFADEVGVVSALALDDGELFWIDDGRLLRLEESAPGDLPLELAAGVSGVGVLAVDDVFVYARTEASTINAV